MPTYSTLDGDFSCLIQNVSLAVEGEYIYLRINFFNPGGIGKQADTIDKENVYIKEF